MREDTPTVRRPEGWGGEDATRHGAGDSGGPPPRRTEQSWGLGPPTEVDPTKTILISREPPTFAWLVIANGPHAGTVYPLKASKTRIGRNRNSDVFLDDDAVSHDHSSIGAEGEKDARVFYIHDLDSANGTEVNGERVLKQALSDDDEIKVGRTMLVFKQVRPRKPGPQTA